MYSVDEIYQNHILNSLVRRPKSKIVVDGMEYTGESHLKTFPKIEHSTEDMFGAFPAKVCEFEIYNRDGSVNFNGKEVSVYRGLVIGGMPQWVPMGIFKAESKDITTNLTTKTIKFKGSDRSRLFDVAFNSALHTYPCTVLDFVKQLCTNHSIVLANEDFPFASLELTTAPEFAEGVTERELIRKIAQLGGCIAQITRNGELKISQPEAASIPITSGKYSSLSKERPVYITTVTISQSGAEDVTVSDSTYVGAYGEYVYKIADNPFIKGRQNEAIDEIKNNIINRSVTPFVLNGFIDDFIYDLNDMVTIRDKSGTEFTTPILSLTTQSRIKSDFKTEVQKEGTSSGSLGGSLKQQVENSIKDNNDFKKAQTGLNELIANAMGLHTSTVDDGAGGKLYYFHNEPALETSTYIVTINSNGFAYTKGSGCWNGGNPTWHYGIDSDGNAVLNTLALHGLVADWIKAGTLQSLNGSTSFNLDKNTIDSVQEEIAPYIFVYGLTEYREILLHLSASSAIYNGEVTQHIKFSFVKETTSDDENAVKYVTAGGTTKYYVANDTVDEYDIVTGAKGVKITSNDNYYTKTGTVYFKKDEKFAEWEKWKSEGTVYQKLVAGILIPIRLLTEYAMGEASSNGVNISSIAMNDDGTISGSMTTLGSNGIKVYEPSTGNVTVIDKEKIAFVTSNAEENATEQEAGFMAFDRGDGTRLYGNISDVYAFRNGATALPAFIKDYFEISDNSPGKLDLEEIFGSILEQTGAVHIRARITLMHYNGNSEYIILWNTTSEQIFVDCRHITGSSSLTGYVKTPVLQGTNNEGTLSKALTIGERPIFYGTSLDIVPKVAGTDVDSYVAAVVEVLTYR